MNPHTLPRTLLRPTLALLILIALSATIIERAKAGGGHYFPPVTDTATLEECGSCHLAYPPAMLPAASWKKMMVDLTNHFGEDASLDPQTTAHITQYLTHQAGDQAGRPYGQKLLKGLPAQPATAALPLRITELPKWKKEHRKITAKEWAKPEVRSKANCAACHKEAEKGYFEDD